jgi:hypothetical protein
MTTACSATVARSRSISFRAAAVAAYSPDCPGRSGTEAAKASNAPCLATRQIGTTVERSAFHRSAASRCVACPVNALQVQLPYFSLGADRRRCRPGLLGSTPMLPNLLDR